MDYLAEDLERRMSPDALEPGAQSVICVADRYAAGARDAHRPGRGRIARYARGEDYHAVIRVRLEALVVELRTKHPAHRFRICVDTAPVLEREHAMRAGLGRVGKHTLLIGDQGLGSWLALGTIVTTLALTPGSRVAMAERGAALPTVPQDRQDPCGSCTRCLDECPTKAITPWSVDATRCISYLTIEHRSTVAPQLGRLVQDWIFGCDICQEVCPHNQPTRRAKSAMTHPAYAPHVDSFDLLTVLGWTPAHWEEAQLHGALRRAGRDMWVRNAALAAGCALRGRELPLSKKRSAELRNALQDIAQRPGEAAQVKDAALCALEP
jgi:epoxyqueuosine reductase